MDGEDPHVVTLGIQGAEEEPGPAKRILSHVADELLPVHEFHVDLARAGRSRLVEILRLRVRRVASEAPHEEEGLEVLDSNLDPLALRIVDRHESKAGPIRIEVGVSLQDLAG